ncbi:MAG: hypothetical protein ACYTEM_01045 [Planctomycetota bacterium]|jgi:competence protein ComGC
MKIKRRAYALTEMLVIIVMIIVLMGLSVRPMRTLVSEIPHSARVCQTLNRSMKALDQLRNDIERSNRIAGLAGGVLTLEQPGGMVRYTLSDGHIARRPAMNDAGAEYIWQLPHLKTETRLWSQSDRPYAVELTTWNQQQDPDREQISFKQTVVFFKKAQP